MGSEKHLHLPVGNLTELLLVDGMLSDRCVDCSGLEMRDRVPVWLRPQEWDHSTRRHQESPAESQHQKSVFMVHGYLGNQEPRNSTKSHQATNLTQEIYWGKYRMIVTGKRDIKGLSRGAGFYGVFGTCAVSCWKCIA